MLLFISLIIYLFTVLWFTVIHRSLHIHNAQFELFWSYKAWIAGDQDLGNEILANVVMFVPFGFLLSALLPRQLRGKVRAVLVIAAAAVFSLTIETLQFFLMRGLCEFDDVVSNVVGAAIGALLYAGLSRWKVVLIIIGAIFTISCLIVIVTGKDASGVEADITPRLFCFQVDTVHTTADEIELTGFAFRYEHKMTPPTIILRSTETGKKVKLDTEQTSRYDVNQYFLCEHDYTMSGFTARGKIESSTEYEIIVKWPWMIPLSTGVYVTDGFIHYAEEKSFVAPDTSDAPDLEEIVNDGTLRVYRPDFHCWVYQKDWSVYWIVNQDFHFEEDGTTYIQYQMWTTQTDKLPTKRLENNWFWDNIGGYFEKYEIEGDFGEYRVMRHEIPIAYSVTSIITGYHKDGEWIWKNYFRPIYEF